MTPDEIGQNQTVEEDAPLRQAVLDLGMEDWIPLPEAADSPEVRATTDDAPETWAALAAVLIALTEEERIIVFHGRWDDNEPPQVPVSEARQLLAQEQWYSFHPDEPEEERIWFVNVENTGQDI